MTDGILDLFRLDGRVALVTGAGSGLGRAFAIALAEAGADLVLVGRRPQPLEETAEHVRQRGCRAWTVPADITQPEACAEAIAHTMAEAGRLDVLVNNAGLGTAVPATRETPEQFRQVLDVNLFASYWMCQRAAAVMPAGSSIVNVSSVLGLLASPFPQAAYASSKAALLGLTRDLSGQWAGRKGIRVNAVAPGYVPTEMSEAAAPGSVEAFVAERSPLGRLGTPQEIAAAVVFLASPASSYVTGTVLAVDGGMSGH